MNKYISALLAMILLFGGLAGSIEREKDIFQNDSITDDNEKQVEFQQAIFKQDDILSDQDSTESHFISTWRKNTVESLKTNIMGQHKDDSEWFTSKDSVEKRVIENRNKVVQIRSTYETTDYIPHEPIYIEGNKNFTEENGVTGGSGTKEDPYTIEGWEIHEATAIRIKDTSAHFVIRNCLFNITSGDDGTIIKVDRFVSNGTIDNVFMDSSKNYPAYCNGILLSIGISNIRITNSTIIAFQGIYCAYQTGSPIYKKTDITIEHCSIYHCGSGILLIQCDGVSIEDNVITIYDPREAPFYFRGLNMHNSDNVSVSDCEISLNDGEAVYMSDCSKHVFRKNDLVDNAEAFTIFWNTDMYYSFYDPAYTTEETIGCYAHDIDTSNTVDGKPVYYIADQSDFVIDGSTDDIGFFALFNCHNATVKNINDLQILIVASEKITVQYCQPSKNTDYGIFLFHSSNNIICNCSIIDSGIILFFSPRNVLRNNTIEILNDSDLHLAISGFFVYGNQTDAYIQDIDVSNSINDKPMYYFVGVEDITIDSSFDFGYLGFVNCDTIVVKGIVAREKGQGVLLVNTTHSQIKRCIFLKNTFGVFIFGSREVTLSRCIFTGINYFGIEIDSSSNIDFLGCICTLNGVHIEMKKCTQCSVGRCYFGYFTGFQIVDCSENVFYQNTIYYDQGMLLYQCDNNEMCFNKICLCTFGICLDFCNGNVIHHNDFRLNKRRTIDIYRTNDTTILYNNFIKNGIQETNGVAISESALDCCVTTINYNNFWGNDIAITSYIFEGEVLNISYNFWGSRDGPSGYGSGKGDVLKVSGTENGEVYFEPWLQSPVLILRRIKGLIFSIDQLDTGST